jgi:alpha-beta hydrolase superfamily lysophospholipase
MERLTLQNRKGLEIVGVLEKPSGEIKGTCVVQHGWGGYKDKPTVQAMKDAFLEAGFQTFNFDTTHSYGESDGDFEKSTLGSFWEDLEDVTKWVQEQGWFIGPLALTGHSKGGYAVTRYAEEHSEEVSYLVPVAPVVSGKMSYEAAKKYRPEEFEKWKRDGVIERIGKEGQVKRQHWYQMEERLQHDLLPNVQKLIMPVLLIVGSRDESCLEQTEVLYEALPDGNKFIEILEDASHSYYEKPEQEACRKAIVNWLKK